MIECEDLFKGTIALLADRAVHVEERLGAAVVKGSYAYGPAEITITNELSGTKELRLRIDGQSLRFAKLLPADADEIARRFGGAPKAPEPVATPEPTPVVEAAAPRVSAAKMMQDRGAQPRAVAAVQPASTAAFSFKPLAIDAAKVAGISALVALVARSIFPWSYDNLVMGVLHALVVWVGYGAAIGILQRSYAPILIRYALGCAAVEQTIFYFARFVGYGSFLFTLESAAVWALFSLGYFAARGSRAPWPHAAAVGAVYGAIHRSLLGTLFGFNAFSVFVSLFAFWLLQLLVERHPDSPIKN